MQNIWDNQDLVDTLTKGGIAVMPTDTLYGVVGKALSTTTVTRLYGLRKKVSGKPCLILISSLEDVVNFSVHVTEKQKEQISKYWPGPVTIILDCLDPRFEYLYRGMNSLAFRVPAVKELRDLLLKTEPLVAPSANNEGMPPAKNITEAKNYFGEAVDFYLDGGEVDGNPSKIIKLDRDGNVSIIRP